MKLISLLALGAMTPSVFAQRITVDWRNTAIANSLMDTYQTYRFRQEGFVELNPLFAGFVNNNKPETTLLGGLALTIGVDATIRSLPKSQQTSAYLAWSLLHLYAVEKNRKRFGYGFPIIAASVKF